MGAQGEKQRRGQGEGWGEKGRKRKPRGSYADLNPPRFGKFEHYPEGWFGGGGEEKVWSCGHTEPGRQWQGRG